LEAKLILWPLFAMFLLVVAVAATMLRRRIAFYKANRIHPQKTATSGQMAATITDTRAPDNFRNLFEVPVLFYVAVLVIYVAGLYSTAFLVLAWVYVAARAAHSFIQCTSNVVMNRFYAFFTSCTVLSIMWLMIAYQLATVK
jgi:hypothetical protein